MASGSRQKAVYTIGKAGKRDRGTFSERPMPDGGNAKVMNETVYRHAVGRADRKLSEVLSSYSRPTMRGTG